MRIALIGYEANIKERVGSNQYAFELLKAIYQLDKENQYQIYLPWSPLPDLPQERKNWQYQVVGPVRIWNLFGLPRALFRGRSRPEVVFSPGHYGPLFSPSPLVISVMDLGFLRYPQQFTKLVLFKLKLGTVLSVKRARHILAISKATRDDIIRYYDVEPNRVTVTYPGYDKKRFHFRVKSLPAGEAGQESERVKKKYKIRGEYVLFLGTLKPNKNLEGLLEAFALVINSQQPGTSNQAPATRHRGPAVRNKPITDHRLPIALVIAGKKGWMYQAIFKKIEELGLEERVIFTGFVDEKDVPGLMSGAKLFVLPSFWEGFGIPVVEAMACGTPVVVSKAGSLPEIAGDAGVVVDPYNPDDIARGMEKILSHPPTHDRLRKKGLKRAKDFSWEDCARKTIKILEKIARE